MIIDPDIILPHKPKCPKCQKVLDAAKAAAGQTETRYTADVSITLCVYCCAVLRIGLDGKFKELHFTEVNQLPVMTQIRIKEAVKILKQAKQSRHN